MKIRAAVLHQMGIERPYDQTKPLVVEEVELQKPEAGEVLVKVRAAGLCHSDLSVIDGNRPRQTPMVLGHEAAAEVVEIGNGVKRYSCRRSCCVFICPNLWPLYALYDGSSCTL